MATHAELRALHRLEMAALPAELLDVRRSGAYPVERSPLLQARYRAAVASVRRREGLEG